jgi:hypothetical protein
MTDQNKTLIAPADKAVKIMQQIGVSTMFSEDNEGMTLSKRTAKKISFIMVNEIISELESVGIKSQYWESVRHHIQNF